VLVLHSWWGLTRGMKATVESLADAGFTALVPDLLGGERPADVEEARAVLTAADPDATAALILSSLVALRAHSTDPEAPVAVLGFSMGASWALWVATRQPESVSAVVDYYGHQEIDFSELTARVLCHFADDDPLITEDQTVEMQAHLLLLDKSVEVHHHAARHFFAEPGVPVFGADGLVDERSPAEAAAAEQAWARTLEFLTT